MLHHEFLRTTRRPYHGLHDWHNAMSDHIVNLTRASQLLPVAHAIQDLVAKVATWQHHNIVWNVISTYGCGNAAPGSPRRGSHDVEVARAKIAPAAAQTGLAKTWLNLKWLPRWHCFAALTRLQPSNSGCASAILSHPRSRHSQMWCPAWTTSILDCEC